MDSILATQPLETLKAWRDEALIAYQKLATGAATVSVAIDGRRKEYSQANLADLNAWIRALSGAIAEKETGVNSNRGRPLYPGLGF